MIRLFLTLSILAAYFISGAQNPEQPLTQYKKQNRDVLVLLLEGETDSAINYFDSYLEAYPDDLESHFGLAAAYAHRGFFYKALKHTKLAVKKGMPIERFMAGPQGLLQPLTDRNSFQRYAQKHGKALLHGPMLVNFTDQSASFWVRTARECDVQFVINNGYAASVHPSSEDDFTGILTIDGLAPATWYQYEVRIENDVMHQDSFYTFPQAGRGAKFSIAFGGGAGYTPVYERMWDTIRTHQTIALLQMGDNVYHDMPEVPDIQRYCYYRRQSRPEYRRLIATTPVYAIWDDHDFGGNDSHGGPAIETPAWKRTTWEIFKQQWGNPYYGGGEQHPGCYFDFGIGDVDFFMLDCRYYRTDVTDDDQQESMLGPVQWQWLVDRLRSSNATFKIIGTSVPISSGTKPGKGSKDTWDGFTREREALYKLIKDEKITGVLFLSGDRHRSDARQTNLPGHYPYFEFMSSRLTNVHTHKIPEGALIGYNEKPSFGLLEIDTEKVDPTITYRIFNIDNEEIDSITLYWSQLTME